LGVHDQLERIYLELDMQMKRLAEVRAELNDVPATVQKLAT
jgi:hypothetical protein